MNQIPEKIPEGNHFVHPLSETGEYEGEEIINAWGFASIVVDNILNPTADINKVKDTFRHLLVVGNPELNVEKAISDIEARSLESCLTACNTVVEGFNKSAQVAFDKL